MRKIRFLPTWPVLAVALTVAAAGGALSQRPATEPASAAPTSSPAPTITTTAPPKTTVTSVRTVTVRPSTPRATPERVVEEPARVTTTTTTPPPVATSAPEPAAPTTPPTTSTSRDRTCDSSYPTICIQLGAVDVDCADLDARDFPVTRPDRHRLDRDRNGTGCESD
ncbi:hypothetical protein [Actinokineospora pegani]|uniref:hypothetical protein n=1 Tax=Actinokineospora pegani TaxID=2654637 RepID=UPI0012EAE438|nr:hypothetical protein [Actinokineospora pegani]